MGTGNVVVESSSISTPFEYTVTFVNNLAGKDVELLVANALPVDFNIYLGDFTNVQSSSTMALTKTDVGLDFTFGIELAPSQEIIVSPQVFKPSDAGVDIKTTMRGVPERMKSRR